MKLLFCIVLAFLPALSGMLVEPGGWYVTLNKPWFNPPSWVFGPVWTILYLTIGIAFYRYITSGTKETSVIALFVIHLILNAAWTVLFFHFHAVGWALFDLIAMVLSLALVMQFFWMARESAGILLLPYLAWCSYAFLLNIWILRNN